MLFKTDGNTLSVSRIQELGEKTSKLFLDTVQANLTETLKVIEINLSGTLYLDSFGLAALCSIHKTAAVRNSMVRLVNPTPPVLQILELTRMHGIFDIVKR